MRKATFALLFLLSAPAFSLASSPAGTTASLAVQAKEGQSLPDVLKRIEKRYGCRISFSYNALNAYTFNGKLQGKTAAEAIANVLKGLPFTFSQKGNFFTITERSVNVRQEAPVTRGFRQSQIVWFRGKVVDEGGEPLIGVTVKAPGGATTVTDVNGSFGLELPRGNAGNVEFSYIGMENAKYYCRCVSDVTGVTIHMKNASGDLKEVVVNGFFSRSKQTYTGAARTITSDQIIQVSPNNLFQALATLDPSMTITQNNAAGSNPNVVPDLVIRSTTSLATNNETGLNSPLVVIDGVESSLQDLYDIDIHDIERVDILKDASATALYGENAANGVIVIQRKRVSQGKVRVRYTFTPQVSFADLSSYDLMNASQKLEFERLAGLYTSSTGSLDQSYYDKLALVSAGQNTDWKSLAVRNSFSQDHSISISGRGQGLDYNLTGNVSLNNGVMKDDGRNKYGLGIFLSYHAIDKLILTLRANHQQVNVKNSKYGSFSNYLLANPYDSPYDEEGNYRRSLSYNMNNPLYEASLNSFDKSETRTEMITLDARYNFKPNLYVTAQGSYTSARGRSDVYKSPDSNTYANVTTLTQKGDYKLTNTKDDSWSAKLVGNWLNTFDDRGTMLTLNLGAEIKHQDASSVLTEGTGFLSDDLADLAYATSYPTGSYPSGSESLASSVGAFAAANFALYNKYIIDGSYRVSGSSKFGSNHRYAPFWSVGLGYNLHNEDFIKKLGWVNTLRLRGSYGYTGSVKFNAYQAVATYRYSSDYATYTGVGAIPITMPNPDLKWQTTKKLNIGLTSSFFGDRLNFNLDVYHENTDDMLIDFSLPPSSGATSVKDNLGSQTSNGVEFSVWGKIISKQDWEWTLSVNGLHSKTTINNISDALRRMNEANGSQRLSSSPLVQYREGESPTAIYAVRSAGIDPASGKEIFIKKDGSYTYTYDADDQVSCGDTNPWMQGSLSTLLRWKQLSMTVNFSYRFGGDLYNSTRAAKIENINPRYNADVRAFTGRWKQPGDVVPYLNISTTGGTSYAYSDRFVEKDNELWLSSMQFTYDVPAPWLQSLRLQKMYLSLGMADLFRLTSAKYERGTSYPYSRSINASVSVTF